MKLTSILLLVASVSAVRIADPAGSHEARANNLKEGLQVVKTQGTFEVTHATMHAKNMKTADEEA